MANILATGAGASAGLEQLFKRLMLEDQATLNQQKFGEDVRSNKATEDYRNRALQEQTALRGTQQAALDFERGRVEENRQRDDLSRRVGQRQPGTQVSPQDMTREINVGGIPMQSYKQQPMYGPQFTGPLPEGEDPNAQSIEWLGTYQQQKDAADAAARNAPKHSPILVEFQDAQAQGYQGTFEQYQNEDANRRKLAGQDGADTKPYFLPQTEYDAQGRPVGAMSFNARTGQANRIELPSGGQFKPPPGSLGTQSILNEVSLDQLDRLKTLFDQGAHKLIGPAAGRGGKLRQIVPGMATDQTFNDFDAESAAFRNAVIKAITGAQMSEPEADRIRQQIPEVTDKPEVWLSKYQATKANLADLNNRIKNKRPVDGQAAPEAASTGTRSKYRGSITIE